MSRAADGLPAARGPDGLPVVREAEGLQLHLSASNASGYKGVKTPDSTGGGWAAEAPRQGGARRYLGTFETAVAAAVAYARAVAAPPQPAAAPARRRRWRRCSSVCSVWWSGARRLARAARARPPPVAEWVQCDACNKWRRLLQSDGALPERWTCELNTGDPARNRCDAPEERTIDSAVDEEHDDGDDEGAEPVAEAEGVPLHMSAVSATGYTGVRRESWRGEGEACYSARYGSATLGRYGTAVEAALAYARHVQTVRRGGGGGAAEGGDDEDASESEEEPKHFQCWQAAGGVGCFGCTLPLGHAGPHRTATDEGSRRRRAAPNRFAQPEGGPESEEAAEHERATQRRLDVRPQPPHPSRDERERRAERALRAAAAERLTLVESHKSNAGYARVTQRGERARPFAAEGLCPHTRRRVSLGCYVTAEEAALAVARNHAAVDDGDAAAEWIGAGGSASTAYDGEYSDYGSYGEEDEEEEEEEEVPRFEVVKPPPRGKKSDEKRRGPKKPLVRDEDGTYRRPAGRGPPGKTWTRGAGGGSTPRASRTTTRWTTTRWRSSRWRRRRWRRRRWRRPRR